MPYYDYFCSGCDHEFNEYHKIADRNIPSEKPCPKCGEARIQQKIGAPGIGDPVRLGLKKPQGTFREVMQEMKKKVPGNKLTKY